LLAGQFATSADDRDLTFRSVVALPLAVERLLNRPYYLYRPTQALRRFLPPRGQVTLPWGPVLNVDPSEALGRWLSHNGVYELAVTEVLHRLTGPGELTVDVGANIGYMTSVLAARVGLGGEVRAFEPHPELFRRLMANCRAWAGVQAIEAAVSDHDGTCRLTIPAGFAQNMGIAAVSDEPGGIPVPCVSLDSAVGGETVGFLKIDAEGHEPQVLEGARTLLSERAIRDIVFEDRGGYPSRASDLLETFGYSIFGIEQGIRGPRIVPPMDARTSLHGGPQNYLATAAPGRARSRLRPSGWHALKSRR
jgi:FkbM family methyltransferase